jgi:hypothetical protein
MKTLALAVTASVLFLTCAAIPASAQQPNPELQPSQQQAEQAAPEMGCGGIMDGRGMMGGMTDHGMIGHGMTGRGMMGRRSLMNPLAMRMIFALMDADGDGKVTLQEWQAAQERIFKAMDADKDGTVSFEEMRKFTLGSAYR